MGVCEARLIVNGQVMFQGEVDKGCGNQVFDYSKVVSLESDPSLTEDNLAIDNVSFNSDSEGEVVPQGVRSETRLTHRGKDPKLSLPVVGSTEDKRKKTSKKPLPLPRQTSQSPDRTETDGQESRGMV